MDDALLLLLLLLLRRGQFNGVVTVPRYDNVLSAWEVVDTSFWDSTMWALEDSRVAATAVEAAARVVEAGGIVCKDTFMSTRVMHGNVASCLSVLPVGKL